jgi:tudor domain-containing protein 1/4/6/7
MSCCYNAGQPCCAQYTEDAQWYRATVLAANTMKKLLKIQYVDYGNTEYQPVDK